MLNQNQGIYFSNYFQSQYEKTQKAINYRERLHVTKFYIDMLFAN